MPDLKSSTALGFSLMASLAYFSNSDESDTAERFSFSIYALTSNGFSINFSRSFWAVVSVIVFFSTSFKSAIRFFSSSLMSFNDFLLSAIAATIKSGKMKVKMRRNAMMNAKR